MIKLSMWAIVQGFTYSASITQVWGCVPMRVGDVKFLYGGREGGESSLVVLLRWSMRQAYHEGNHSFVRC